MSHTCALAHGPTALPQAGEQGADTGDVTGGAPPIAYSAIFVPAT